MAHIQTFCPDRCFIINTDLDSFRRDYPRACDITPFRYWLAEGFAYVTPSPEVGAYDNALSELVRGDTVFAYENRVGIVAMGTVVEPPDLQPYFDITPVYPDPHAAVKRIKMSWDTSINCSFNKLTSAGTTPRGGSIPLWRVKSSKMKNLLAELVAQK
jgi:hypothetical protein